MRRILSKVLSVQPLFKKASPVRAFSSLNLVDVVTMRREGEDVQFSFKGESRLLRVKDQEVGGLEGQTSQWRDIESLDIMDLEGNHFSKGTLLEEIMDSKFMLVINGKYQVNLMPDDQQPTYGQVNQISSQGQKVLQDYQEEINCNAFAQRVYLSEIVSMAQNKLNALSSTSLDKNLIKIVMQQIIVENYNFNRRNSNTLDQMLNFLEAKQARLEEEKNALETKLDKKARRGTRVFVAFLYSQIFFVQYGTYVSYSWDILEPIACLLGISDMAIAYSFWLFAQKDLSLQELNTQISEHSREHFFRKNGSNVLDDLQELHAQVIHLKKERLEHSDDYMQVLEVLEENKTRIKQ